MILQKHVWDNWVENDDKNKHILSKTWTDHEVHCSYMFVYRVSYSWTFWDSKQLHAVSHTILEVWACPPKCSCPEMASI